MVATSGAGPPTTPGVPPIMSTGLLSLRERFTRLAHSAKKARETSKELVTEVVGTVMGAATAAALGALDEAKGEVKDGDATGIKVYSVGPVPASLIVGGLGKVGAMAMVGDGMAPIAGDIGQAGIDVAAYITGRRAYRTYKDSQ